MPYCQRHRTFLSVVKAEGLSFHSPLLHLILDNAIFYRRGAATLTEVRSQFIFVGTYTNHRLFTAIANQPAASSDQDQGLDLENPQRVDERVLANKHLVNKAPLSRGKPARVHEKWRGMVEEWWFSYLVEEWFPEHRGCILAAV